MSVGLVIDIIHKKRGLLFLYAKRLKSPINKGLLVMVTAKKLTLRPTQQGTGDVIDLMLNDQSSNKSVRHFMLSSIVDELCRSAPAAGVSSPNAPSMISAPLNPMTKR